MQLAETQRTIAAALMAPPSTNKQLTRAAAKLLCPNDRLTSIERLQIYQRSYWARLIDSLKDDFPGLLAVLGNTAFERLAPHYLADCPSRSFTLRDLGSQLETWLTKHKKFAGRQAALALDMVRLEWAHILAFDGPTLPLLAKPTKRLGIQPHVSLLYLQYPVDELRIHPKSTPRRSQIFLAVHRVDLLVYYKRLSKPEFQILQALRNGKPLGEAVQLRPNPESLESWFAEWTRFGWLTPLVRPR